jgi:hypothetical protein
MTYAEHRERQHKYERETFSRLSAEEQMAVWHRRQAWLWSHFLTLESRWVAVLSECIVCRGVMPLIHSWPTFFECRCGVTFVLDKSSHLCPDDIERVSIMTPRMLEVFAAKNPKPFDPFDYSLEQRLRDLRGAGGKDL